MSARDAILQRIRRANGATADGARAKAVKERLENTPAGIIPERGQLDAPGREQLFRKQAETVSASVVTVKARDDVPKAVTSYLRSKNLPSSIRMGNDQRLRRMPWKEQRSLEVLRGASDGNDLTAVSHASAGIAETGTLVVTSGKANPTSLNFLPEHQIVVLDAKDIQGDMESAIAQLRKKFGKGEMPRTVNFITGPSRSGDVEQKIILGAHGPRALHIIVVG
jgi:L-lactate dehydrogenase complex protein LldG